MSDLDWNGCRRLAAAMLWRTVRDWHTPIGELEDGELEDLLAFPESAECALFCGILGWHPDYFRRLLTEAKTEGFRSQFAGRRGLPVDMGEF